MSEKHPDIQEQIKQAVAKAELITSDTKENVIKAARARASEGTKTSYLDANGTKKVLHYVELGLPTQPEQGRVTIHVPYDEIDGKLVSTGSWMGDILKIDPQGESEIVKHYEYRESPDGLQVKKQIRAIGGSDAAPVIFEGGEAAQSLGATLLNQVVEGELVRRDEAALGLDIMTNREGQDLLDFIKKSEVLPSTFEE